MSLGSDYYVQRTAHECGEIIDRRVTKIKTEAAEVRTKLDILKTDSKAGEQHETEDLPEGSSVKINEEGLLEITEVYQEETD